MPCASKVLMAMKSPAPVFFVWLSVSEAARFLDVSVDTIARRGIPWQEIHVPGRLRYKLLNLGGEKKERRYTVEDCEALLEKA